MSLLRRRSRAWLKRPAPSTRTRARAIGRLWRTTRLLAARHSGIACADGTETAACNRAHELEERLARWLLMCHDRVGTDRLTITGEFLAMMLGTRRTTMNVAAGILQKAGLIAHSRGHVTIADHGGLADAACECYQTVHDEYLRFGLP